jgi:uncharacterized protein with HEPN domain
MSDHRRDSLVFLEDILFAISRIEKYVGDMSLENFSANEMAIDAVVRNFEIIGEAARNLPEAIRVRHPAVAWREAVGLRNVLIHEYFGVDAEVLWHTAKSDLPALRADIERVFEAEKNDEPPKETSS